MPPIFSDYKYLYLPTYWRDFFPILYYCLGAYFRKYPLQLSKKVSVVLLLGTTLLLSSFDYWYSDGGVPHYYGGGYGSAVTILLVALIFHIFIDVDIQAEWVKSLLRYVAGISLEIYLGLMISDVVTKKIMSSVTMYDHSGYRFDYYFIEVPINFVVALLLAVIVHTCFNWVKQLSKDKAAVLNNNT